MDIFCIQSRAHPFRTDVSVWRRQSGEASIKEEGAQLDGVLPKQNVAKSFPLGATLDGECLRTHSLGPPTGKFPHWEVCSSVFSKSSSMASLEILKKKYLLSSDQLPSSQCLLNSHFWSLLAWFHLKVNILVLVSACLKMRWLFFLLP